MQGSKTRDVFPDMVVLKNPKRTQFFSDLSLPSYMRDWLVMKFSDENGDVDINRIDKYIKEYIPSREDFEQIKFRLINGEAVRFLARIRVSVDIKKGQTTFEMPDFGGSRAGASGIVENSVADKWQETLLRESENWGIVELLWTQDYSSKKASGYIEMVDYNPFCPYVVDLDVYREGRREFTTEEWIDLLISSADYNPRGYDNEEQKLYILRRLLPFVERRVNLDRKSVV